MLEIKILTPNVMVLECGRVSKGDKVMKVELS